MPGSELSYLARSWQTFVATASHRDLTTIIPLLPFADRSPADKNYIVADLQLAITLKWLRKYIKTGHVESLHHKTWFSMRYTLKNKLRSRGQHRIFSMRFISSGESITSIR